MDRLLKSYIQWNLKFWGLNLLLAVALTIGGGYFATRVTLDSDLESLLPKKSSTVIQMNEIQEKSGGSQDFKLILTGGSFEKRVEAAEAFIQFLNDKHPDFARSIRYKTPKPFFEENKFKLIPPESLDAILKKIERERKKNAAVTDPLGLEETIEEEEKERSKIADAQAPHAPAKSEEEVTQDDQDMDHAKDLLRRLEDMRPYYQSEDGSRLAIRILPKSESFNVNRNRSLLMTMKDLVREFDFKRFDSQIHVDVFGTIFNHISRFESIMNDVSFGGIGILLILVIVAIYFRSLWALTTTVPPLITGLAVGMGVTGLLEGALNTIAIFLVLVVFGVGIEFGIHLWARYLDERRNKSVDDALDITWRSTGRATLTASTALLCGFALLCFSTFQGFAQFGRVAIILVIAAAGSFVFFMPTWIILAERLRGLHAWPSTLAEKFLYGKLDYLWPQKLLAAFRWISVILLILGIGVAAKFFRFDYSFEENVSDKKISSMRKIVGEIFSERLTPSAVAVFKDQKTAADFMDAYRLHKKDFPEIHLMSGLSSFLPLDQELRIKKLQDIADDLEPEWIEKFDDPLIRKALAELKEKAYDQKIIRYEDIPTETREPFLASDGSGDQMVFIFDKGGNTDGLKSMRFRAEVERFVGTHQIEPALLSGGEFIFADIVARVTEEGPWLVLGMFVLVFMICWLDFRSLKDALVTMAPVLAGFVYTGLILVLQGTMINFFNMVALASLGAMVVDNSIHLFHRFKEMRDEKADWPERDSALAVGPPIFVCTLTSICGYGGMAFANHNGIASLGFVAIVGLVACFVSAVFFFPAWLGFVRKFKR